jgi:diphosphomevalonate decarboxylase
LLRKFLISAPSNIALIKYMGKVNSSLNLPANASLSMTLDSLRTWVEIECDSSQAERIQWLPEMPSCRSESQLGKQNDSNGVLPPAVPQLSEAGRDRIVKHAARVREGISTLFPAYGLVPFAHAALQIKSANTFPAASGIASSASSFAAVTLATAIASSSDLDSFSSVWKDKVKGPRFRQDLAQISRQGSGSSCRSFEGPWVLWDDAVATSVESSLPEMTDLVVLISSDSKEVSSSQAHARVQASPLWLGRVERTQVRIHDLKQALKLGNLQQISKIAWSEMWEMHSLFHTCNTPFTYWQPDTIRVLQWLSKKMETPQSPIVTLDAGPNIHIIVETSKAEEWKVILNQEFPSLKILQDRQGRGATWKEI